MTLLFFFFFFNDTATTEIYTLSLHDALPIFVNPTMSQLKESQLNLVVAGTEQGVLMVESEALELPEDVMLGAVRSEEHTSELQSPCNLVCRLLLEKKKKRKCNNTEAHKYDCN